MKTRASEQPKQAEPQQRSKDGVAYRVGTVESVRAEGDKPASVRMSVSSELPVLTYAWFNEQYQRVWEVLDHSPECVDMARCKDGLVVLDRHYGDQIGLMACKVENRKLGGTVEFCSGVRAKEIAEDAARGLRRNVSVGYRVDASSYRLDGDKDGIPVVRAMSWMPYEASFEPVPADPTVGVGRAAATVEAKPPAQGAPAVAHDNGKTESKESRNMDPKDVAKLFARAAEFGVPAADVEKLIVDGKGRAELDALIVERQAVEVKELKAKAVKPSDKHMAVVDAQPLGGDKKTEQQIVRKYSVMNVLRHAAGISADVFGNKVDVGFEREIDQECRKAGMGSVRGGQFLIPHAALAKRDFTVSGTSSASVASNLYAGDFIDLLRTRYVMGQLGVRFMTGLAGNVAIPKMTAGNTGYWVAESGDITESQPTLGQVTGTPHTCGVMTDISRRLLLQSTPDAESMVRDEITQRIARTVQIAVFQGTGADGQPSAITTATGINNPSVTQGTPTFAELLGFPGNIMSDNAEVDGQKWAFTGEVWQKLAATFTDGTAKAEHVLDWKSRTCLGFPYFVSEDVGANSAFFGDFSTIVVGVWGAGLDLNLDTATLSSSGGLRIVGLQDVDVMVRLGQALAYNAAVTS